MSMDNLRILARQVLLDSLSEQTKSEIAHLIDIGFTQRQLLNGALERAGGQRTLHVLALEELFQADQEGRLIGEPGYSLARWFAGD